MNYLGCQGCENYKTIELHDLAITCCWANVNNPLKCGAYHLTRQQTYESIMEI